MHNTKQHKNPLKNTESGSTLTLVFFAAVMLAALTVLFYRQMDTAPTIRTPIETQIRADNIISHAIMLKTVASTMVLEGVDPSDIDDIAPSDGSFNTQPNTDKIYHPYGGGAEYKSSYNGWSGIKLHTSAAVNEVGPGAGDDIMAVGYISNEILCEKINEKLYDDTTITSLSDTNFDNVVGGTTAITLNDAICTGPCDQRPYQCLENASGDEYLYYHVLYAQ